MKTIIHAFHVKADRSRIFEALTTVQGLASWWTTSVEIKRDVVYFTFSADFNPHMKVEETIKPELLRWRCIWGHEPWQDNLFTFDLVEEGAQTLVRFKQHYAVELDDDTYGIYNYNWGYYLESLRLYCENKQGKPYQPG